MSLTGITPSRTAAIRLRSGRVPAGMQHTEPKSAEDADGVTAGQRVDQNVLIQCFVR
jgi:hypothetical protein